jgi:1-deoxy-D-xylulose-5-phosphate reductoisomerase
MPQGVTILGATGSIGASTLDIIARNPERFRVVAVSAHKSVAAMVRICQQFQPKVAVMVDEASAKSVRQQLTTSQTKVLAGKDALLDIATHSEANQVMAAIVGAAGLEPTLAAVRAGKQVLLANKESLVMAGKHFMQEVADYQATLLPVDSEHNAIFQSLPNDYAIGTTPEGINKIILTGSGGPFLREPLENLASKTPKQAIAHPNWDMGAKISVDSATMMNKGLEWIEACLLFNMKPEQVEIVIHPQSVIHSMVEYQDGSTIAQLGRSDMRVPIANVMGLPERITSGVEGLDFSSLAAFEFLPADETRFPCLRLAREAFYAGEAATTILNAANEIAVESFLNEHIMFTDIPIIIEKTLEKTVNTDIDGINSVIMLDQQARQTATAIIQTQ